ncbi:hypothetical protein Vretimale_2831 [Volvox reticuliferus]|uniref:Uncharacterized protein n=1 Tax=Volvox reticuliferus TaxID=1737510 RepID=A0A8J4D8G3_9CHLO|nr:hypothetical protein Vretifemale_1837 [Volvox reticuliferus]GIL97085.1 hypothetical protein Vretimale_2831 [Volvox reticuliferus]
MATPMQRAVLIVGAASGLGFGGYYFSQLQEVQKYEKDKKDIERLIETERKRLTTTAKVQAEQESRISEAESQVRERQKAIKDLELKLDAARKAVQQLEQQLKGKNDDLQSKQKELQSAQSRLADLRSETERAKQSVTMGEKSLLLANQKVAEAKLLTNPLNHPKVKTLLGKK